MHLAIYRCKGNELWMEGTFPIPNPVCSQCDLIWFDTFIWTRKSHWQQSFLLQEIPCAQNKFCISIIWNREKTKQTQNIESVKAIKTQLKFKLQTSGAAVSVHPDTGWLRVRSTAKSLNLKSAPYASRLWNRLWRKAGDGMTSSLKVEGVLHRSIKRKKKQELSSRPVS